MNGLVARAIFLAALCAAPVSAEIVELDLEGADGLALSGVHHFLDGESVSIDIQYSKPIPQGYGFAPVALKPLEKSYATDDVKEQLRQLKEYAYSLMPDSVVRAEKGDARYNLQIDVAAQEYIVEGKSVPHKIRFALSRKTMRRDILRGTYKLEAAQDFASAAVVGNLLDLFAGIDSGAKSNRVATN